MRQRLWSRARTVLFLSVSILAWYSAALSAKQASAQESARGKQAKIPDEFAVTLTGRILSPEKEPLVGMSILVSETEREKVAITWRTGDDGKLLNPTGETDSTGRFTIVADRRFWQKTGYFTLQGGLIPGTLQNAGILRGSLGEPIIIKLDPKAKKFDVGDITISTE